MLTRLIKGRNDKIETLIPVFKKKGRNNPIHGISDSNDGVAYWADRTSLIDKIVMP